METADIMLFTVYTVALALIVIVIMRVFFPARTVIVREEPEVVVGWWPWSVTRFNEWPYWTGWYSGGSDGGYVHHRPHHTEHRPRTSGAAASGAEARPWGSGGRGANAGTTQAVAASGARHH